MTFVTDPSPGNNESFVYVAAYIDQQNVTVSCELLVSGSGQIPTSWRNVKTDELIEFSLFGVPTAQTYKYLKSSGSANGYKDLEIDKFYSTLDRLMLACFRTGVITQQFVFFFGVPGKFIS